MKLVKIDDYTYVNPESIGAIEDGSFGTNIYLTGSDKPIETSAEIKKVLDAICGSEEHLEKNEQIISEVINNLKKIDNISSVKIEYIRSDLGQPGGFLVQKN
ncbi:hypothetical protein [Pediococcus acidilactici]|uniref:hypothetical protein n=1 Tax=Pediococcus acidilactici TaxID=1254 RepID=UPI00132BDEB5|nr:hypothetical protein [Pediococcus acidilactici]KAF0375323.1 hypothetical protein GBO57_04610 [Pediococcus acidilactici]KAF0406715.1 hypothetical protein GBO76_04560 [Pediococcus acidilactici]KAF0418190.1 hypothetical protein GBO81_04560 [Pediococcus acidilactici]KAF0455471.1 hypothetical protein GBP01_04545 [Pediococcus acidilactici]KAF0486543.1 hypothetical protein GBP17_04605 [Pediococcus acidilactici]